MNVEQLSPWISLLSGVLSIGYLVVDDLRKRSGAHDARNDENGARSLGAILQEHDGVVLTAVTLFFVAGLLHWYTRGTGFFYPVLYWGTAGFVVVVVAIGEATGAVDVGQDARRGAE